MMLSPEGSGRSICVHEVVEDYRAGRLSRARAAKMLGLCFHEAETLFKKYGVEQQSTWDEQEAAAQAIRSLLRV